MDTIGLDLHKRETQLCVLAPDGTAKEQRTVTNRERCTAVLGPLAPATVLLEASTENEWVARHLEALGHRVIVADPNYAPMYATRSRRVKTDRRDARTLAEARRVGAYRPAHRLSDARRHVRAELAVRDALVRTRTRYIALAKALVRRDGRDPVVALLTTAPGVGRITASALVATIDDITRCRSAHEFEAYLGLVRGERSSGEKRRVGRITKAGNARVRWLLVEATWRIVRSRSEETVVLRTWAAGIATRRGKRVAVVALARRLAGMLYAMWRDGVAYDGRKVRAPRPRPASVA